MPAMPDDQEVDYFQSQSQEECYNCRVQVPLFPQVKRCYTEDGKPLVVDIGVKCKGSKEEIRELEKAGFRVEGNGTVYIFGDDIPNMQNVYFREPVTTTEDSFDDGEQPEKGSELTVHLDETDYSEKKPTEPLSEQHNESQDERSTIIEEATVVEHEKSSLVIASPNFNCLSASTFDPSYVDNRHEKSIPLTTHSRQVNSESQDASLGNNKASGRKVTGDPQNSKGESSQQQNQEQQKQKQQEPTTGGDCSDVSGSGDAGDERRDDEDGGRRRGNGDGRKDQSSTQGEEEVKEEVEVEEEEEEEEKGTEEKEEKDTEEKIVEEKEEKDIEEKDEDEEQQQENLNSPAYISKCLKAVMEYARDQKNGVCNQPTEFTRRGDCFLKHLQQCHRGHTACKNCHFILYTFEDLVSSTPDAFPFYKDYERARNKEERLEIILLWLLKSLPEKKLQMEACCENLKRMRFSSSQGARPKKKFKQAGSSNKAMAMETTPSPDIDPVGIGIFPGPRGGHVLNRRPSGVTYGDQETCRNKICDWIQNHDATDGETNDGVIFNRELTPSCCYYRPGKEFHKMHRLGSGSFGEVFLCFDEETKKHFVCKFVPFENFEVDETLIWMRLEHQYIVPLWGVVRHGSVIMMLSKYIPCRPLSIMNDEVPRSDRNIVKWIKQLLCVLEYIHSMNIVHMDIKPANILLTYDDDIVLIDWGLAMELNNNGQQIVSNPRGTAQFMAPEVCRCEAFNATIDVWSTICSAINLFTGSPPWMKRFPGLKSYVYLVGTRPPPVEDIPASLDPAIRGFLIEGFGDNDTRPTASQLLGHPMFDLDNLRRYTTSMYENINEGLEDVEMDTERFPIPPPDSLQDLDTSCILEPLRQEENSHPVDVGDCEINQMSPAQVLECSGDINQVSLAQRCSCSPYDGSQRLDNRTFLRPLGRAPTPPTIRPQDLPIPQGKYTQGGYPELDDVTVKFSNLDVDDEQIDDEDLYGPGPEKEPEPEPHSELSDSPGMPATPRSSDRSFRCGTSGSTSTPVVTPDRRSSSQSSVFGDLFQCLPSTPDYEPTASASAASYRKQQSFSNSSQQLSYLESLYSELTFQSIPFQAEQLQIENTTSGIGTASGNQVGNLLTTQGIREPVPRSRTESQSSRNSSGTYINVQVFDEQVRVVNSATMTYGELAKGISSKVFGIFGKNGKPNAKFILQDQAGNTFDVYAKVDPTCEIVVVEASQDGEWQWCISPDGLEDKY
ncbi:uncharacterized protein LOC117100704 isoform X2 [Anneissia japonica]|uniref:uncharacterized protein LOC117100704 isoform X2 n=1 Tax=Anneissia japonica TaxID=1529436 RepID=UPI0014259891|nr:uncharacterized protein LOC117100704 isoform X2 [Anneissia japonica]